MAAQGISERQGAAKSDANRGELSFRLYVIPPPGHLDWSSPRTLLRDTLKYHLMRDKAPIGHLFVEFDHGTKKVLTGMSRKSKLASSIKVARDKVGLGTFFRDFAGKLDSAAEAIRENKWALARGRLRVIRVPITSQQSEFMAQEMEKWIRNGSFRHYGGGHKILQGEGAGCAEFGMHFLSLALGVNSATHPMWVRRVVAPRALTGAPMTTNRVSMLRLRREGKAWGLEDHEGFVYQTPDPELIFKWLKSYDPSGGQEVVLKPSDVNWATPGTRRIEFSAGYASESDSVVQERWQRICTSS